MKKIVSVMIAAVLAAAMAVSAAGCKSTSNVNDNQSAGKYGDVIPGGVSGLSEEVLTALSDSGNISVYSFDTEGSESESENNFIEYFNEVYGGTVTKRYIQWEAWESVFITNFAANDAPDVISLFSKLWPKAATRGMVYSKAELEEMGVIGLDHPYIAGSTEISANNFGYADNIFGLYTYSVSPVVMVVNDDLLKSCGVETTPYEYYQNGQWTWDNFLKVCAQVCSIDMDGQAGADYSGYYGWDMNYIVASNGGEIISLNDDGTVKTNFDSQKVVNGLQMVRDLYGTYKYSSTKSSDFKGGTVAMFAEQHYNVSKQINNSGNGLSFKWSVVPLPRGADNTDGYCMGNSDSYAVVSSTQNPQGAVNYLIARAAYSEAYPELDPDYDLEYFLDDDGKAMLDDLRLKVAQPPYKGVGNVWTNQWEFWNACRSSKQTVNEIIQIYSPWFNAQCQSENNYLN